MTSTPDALAQPVRVPETVAFGGELNVLVWLQSRGVYLLDLKAQQVQPLGARALIGLQPLQRRPRLGQLAPGSAVTLQQSAVLLTTKGVEELQVTFLVDQPLVLVLAVNVGQVLADGAQGG